MLQPGKIYSPLESNYKAWVTEGRRAIKVYVDHEPQKEQTQLTLHYRIWPGCNHPFVLFVEMDVLYQPYAERGSSFSHYRINGPLVPLDYIRNSAGKFLHEDRIVWILAKDFVELKMVNDA